MIRTKPLRGSGDSVAADESGKEVLMANDSILYPCDLLVDDDRVLELLERLEFIIKVENTYYLTEKGKESELGKTLTT